MIIVTGGAGFIGSNLLAALEARGERDLVVCDRLGHGEKWRNIAKRDIADFIYPEELLGYLDSHAESVRVIFHMGAVSATTENDADLILRTNYRLSGDLWRWCVRHPRCQFIYASSAATYGDGSAGFEDPGADLASAPASLAALRPLNPYGWSKHLFDRNMARRVLEGDLPKSWAGLKFFNVYGPNEYHKGSMKSVVAHLAPRLADGEPARLFKSRRDDYADGGQLRDFVHVDDCTSIMLWLMDHPEVMGLFNCGTGRARSFDDLAAAVFAALGLEPRIEYFDMPESLRDKYQYYTQASDAALRAAGYDRPFASLEDGVRDYVKTYLTAEDPYR